VKDSSESHNDVELTQMRSKRLRSRIEEFLPVLVNAFYVLPLFVIPHSHDQYKVPAAAAVAIIGFIITMLVSRRFRGARIKILKAIADKKGVAGFSEIQLSTGLSTGSINYHLERLRKYVTKNSKYYVITEEGLQLLRQVDPKYDNVRSPKRTEEHVDQNINTPKLREEAKTKFTLFFGMIYVFVAAIAVSQALETFNEVSLGSMLWSNTISHIHWGILLTLIGFFLTAIPFVHAAIIYLATDATVELTKGNPTMVLANFTVLFLQVSLLSFMASNISEVTNFMKLAIALMLLDVIWVIIFIRKPDVVFIEWLQFNSLGAIFLVVALLVIEPLVQEASPLIQALIEQPPDVQSSLSKELLPKLYPIYAQVLPIYFIIVAVLFFRTFCDYRSLWNEVYSKRILQEF
jgi:hypothetical protein